MSALAAIRLEAGFRLQRLLPAVSHNGLRSVLHYEIVGRLDGATGTPFLLSYQEPGMTRWACAAELGASLRRKILQRLREDVRAANVLPAWLALHDLTELDVSNRAEADAVAHTLTVAFFNDVWRARYLNDHDADYVTLAVPFLDRAQAKAAGALWDPQSRAWRVRRGSDMAPFARWLPANAATT